MPTLLVILQPIGYWAGMIPDLATTNWAFLAQTPRCRRLEREVVNYPWALAALSSDLLG